MEDMDIDQIVHIPDTPDRPPGRHINIVQSEAGHPRSESLNQLGARGKRLANENGFQRKLQLPSRQNPIDVDAFEPRNKSTAFSLENSRRSENASLFRRAGVVINSKADSRHSVGVRDKQKAQPSKVNVKRHNSKDSPLNLSERDVQDHIFNMAFPRSRHGALEDRESKEGRTSANADSSLQFGSTSSGISGNAFKGKEKIDFNIYSTTYSAVNGGKGIDLSCSSQNKVEKQMPVANQSVTPPKVIGQKRLVRNGCISPLNKANNAEKIVENLKVGSDNPEGHNNKNLIYDRASQGQVDINEIIAEDYSSYKARGKRPIVHPHSSKKPNTSIAAVSDCNSVLSKKGADETNGVIRDGMSGSWRTTHSIQSKVDHHLLHRDSSANEQLESEVVKKDNAIRTGRNFVGNALPKKPKKRGPLSRNQGECSTVASDDSDIFFLGSSREPSTSRSSRVQNHQHQATLDPINEVDELSVGGRTGETHGRISTSKVDSDSRARQLEADEVLARELQEQLYNETPLHSVDEIDESVAWALQHAEDVLPGSSTYGLGISNSRSSSTAHSHRLPQTRSRPSQQAANRRVPQAQAQAHTSRVSQLRSRFLSRSPIALPRPAGRSSPVLHGGLNLQFPLSMDLDMRLNILEELETALSGNHFLQRDFNENDYEMLLALDDDITHRPAASANQINSLPESVVQTANLEETCAVCLESPAVGETIRHLPCLHKFHKDCIDPWLSRKTSCPVCKSSVT